jgi:hypothetical protein
MKPMAKGLTIVLGAVLVAFATFGPAAAQEGNRNAPTVTVENARGVPVTVYLERGLFDVRLGTVSPHGSQVFNLPPYLTEGEKVQIFAHPDGSVDLGTQELTVRRGEHLTLLVPASDVADVPELHEEVMPNPAEGAATVTVQNGLAKQVTVFVERGEFDIRLGTVAANREQTLTLPSSMADENNEVDLFVHPAGGVDSTTQTFELTPGAHLVLEVPGK